MVYEFFFTGGLDSTYRLCQLAREEGNVVQPVYIVFDDKGGRYNRPELRRELEAQDKILGYVSANPNTKAEILPIRRISWDKIPYDKQIMDSEEALAGYNFAWQYIFIALYAKWHPGVELCQETLSDSLGIKFREADGRRWIDTTDLDATLVLAFQNVPDLNYPVYNWLLPLSVFIFLWINDTGAYCAGSLFGKHKLFPRISPAKSWEGSIGGAIFVLIAAGVIFYIEQQGHADSDTPSHSLSLLQWLGLGLVVVVFGTLGDLVESLLKRTLNIKDSGNILPGHGGMLDRFDSSLMAIPAAVVYIYTLTLL